MAKTDNNDAVFFGFDSFIDVPARRKVRKEVGHRELVADEPEVRNVAVRGHWPLNKITTNLLPSTFFFLLFNVDLLGLLFFIRTFVVLWTHLG